MAAESSRPNPSTREGVLFGIDAIREAHPGISVDMSNALTIRFNVGIRPPRTAGGLPTQVIIATSLSPAAVGKEKLSLVSVRQDDTVNLYHIDSDMAGDAMTGQLLEDAQIAELDSAIVGADFSSETGVAELGQRLMAGKYSNWMHAMFDTGFIQ